MRNMNQRLLRSIIPVLLLLIGGTALAAGIEPISGSRLDSVMAWYDTALITALEQVFPEDQGYFVTGPLNPFISERVEVSPDVRNVYRTTRVVCPDLRSLRSAESAIRNQPSFQVTGVRAWVDNSRKKTMVGYRGVLVECRWSDDPKTIEFLTTQQLRWLLWADRVLYAGEFPGDKEGRREYALAVSDYLSAIDRGSDSTAAPSATSFGLPAEADLFAESPPFVIRGFENYLDYLHTYRAIYTDFASGIITFQPSDSLLQTIKERAARTAFPNKEAPRLQAEYREFFSRGGDVRTMSTLTRTVFDSLSAGEYFFAVGLTGKIRFGRELPRLEVERTEKETGRKVPRGNHAFLFPGEPVLTAGSFVVKNSDSLKLTAANAGSGHYFYSNIRPTIRRDISEYSDQYLLTLGHFFESLNRLGIPCSGVLISKF
jgi:hypothetical protein